MCLYKKSSFSTLKSVRLTGFCPWAFWVPLQNFPLMRTVANPLKPTRPTGLPGQAENEMSEPSYEFNSRLKKKKKLIANK